MKTQILYLEPFDTLASVKDKLHWRQAEQIALILPSQRDCGIKKELSQQLGMELLHRYALNAGVKIALVTKDHSIVKLAQRVGLPVFPEIQIARKAYWHVTKKYINNKRKALKKIKSIHQQKLMYLPNLRLKKQTEKRKIYNPFADYKARLFKQRKTNNHVNYWIGMGLIGALAVFLLLPSAEINLSPIRIKQEKTLVVIADADQSLLSLSGVIPLIKKEIRVSGEKEIETSGHVSMILEDGTGKVRFKNLSNQEIIVPKGTIVSIESATMSKPIKMMTLEEASLPPRNSKQQDDDREVAVLLPLRGLDKIPAFNEDLALESPLGLDVIPEHLVIDPPRLKKQMPMAAEKDKERLHSLLLSELIAKVKQGKELTVLDDNTKKNDVFLSENPVDINILREEFVPQDNIPSEKLLLRMDLQLRWDIALGQHYLLLGNKILDQEYGKTEGKYIITENVTATFLTKPSPIDSNNKRYSSKVKFYRSIIEKIPLNEIYVLVRGLPRDQAVTILDKHFLLEKSPTVVVYPPWLNYLPLLPFRYTVNVQ